LQFTVGDEREDEMLVPQADQLRDLAGRGVGGGEIPGHGFILPCSPKTFVRVFSKELCKNNFPIPKFASSCTASRMQSNRIQNKELIFT